MPAPPRTPHTFLQVLEQVWWRLDRALDLEMLEWSAKLAAVEALQAGCTAIVDHHESPNAIEGSLTVLADACAEVGVRVVCAYGVTDRHGADGAARGLAENDRFLSEGGRGMVGVHAAFTCTDDTLAAAAELADRHGVGVHIHVAEGPDDVDAPPRLAGLTDDRWLLIHGVHLPDDHGLRGTIVHNPRSNMNNAVGYAAACQVRESGGARHRRDRRRHARRVPAGVRAGTARTISPRRPISPGSGSLDGWDLVPEARDDRVTWNYPTIEPWHLAYSTGVDAVDVDVDGEPALRGGRPTRVDVAEVRAKASEQAQRLFRALEELD